MAFAPQVSQANGQTTHIWITERAVEQLDDGELKAFATREDLRAPLVHGTMFPDGGDAVGDGDGEVAHWESFQQVYMQFIVDNYDQPWTDEAASHIAFWLGMSCQGMADQSFDATCFSWSRHYDAELGWAEGESFDTASDVLWAALKDPAVEPELW